MAQFAIVRGGKRTASRIAIAKLVGARAARHLSRGPDLTQINSRSSKASQLHIGHLRTSSVLSVENAEPL